MDQVAWPELAGAVQVAVMVSAVQQALLGTDGKCCTCASLYRAQQPSLSVSRPLFAEVVPGDRPGTAPGVVFRTAPQMVFGVAEASRAQRVPAAPAPASCPFSMKALAAPANVKIELYTSSQCC